MNNTVAVYGGAANPPHLGHGDAIRQLLAQAEEVIFIPSFSHAFGKEMAPFEHRLAMAGLLVTECFPGEHRVKVDAIERTLGDGDRPVYSIDVLRALQQRDPGKNMLLAVGPDNADPQTWSRFRDHEAIDRDFGRLFVQERIPVRSTDIRERLAASTPAETAGLRPWLEDRVGSGVAGYILEHGLYGTGY